MHTYVSLLRGINVGGRTVKMADLKSCYEKAGFANVSTLLQSGNVLSDSSIADPETIRAKLEAAVSSRFGYAAKIFVLRQNELPPIIAAYPFDSSDEEFQHYVIFLRPGLATELSREPVELDPQLEQIAEGSEVLYWKVKKGMTLKSPFSKVLTKAKYKDLHTMRNIKTLKKLSPA